jgi:hypothetical protein
MPAETRFEHYEVLRREDGSLWELGRGAMGVTYKALDTDLHCTVALKVINPAILDTEGTEQRFFREARAAAQLRHPNIATVLRLGKTEDATHFYAMEFCEGDTLDQFVAARGVLDVEQALDFTLQVTKALVLAEEHQVVHRDIKPANLIVVSQRGEGFVVKIIDFGLAKSAAGSANSWTSMSLATAGYIGTAHFSSPEQLEEGQVDVRSDIYSLGATLWFMLTGRPMFAGSVPRVMSQHLSSPLPWEQFDSISLPESVRLLLSSMLAKSPMDRPQSALDLKQFIQVCLEEVRNPKPPEFSPAADVLNNRWKLLEECRASRGNFYRAVDLKEQGKIVSVRMLDPLVSQSEAEWQHLEQTLRLFQAAPDSIVGPIKLDRDEKNRPFLVTEWVNGIPLVTLLRRRGSFSWKEMLKVLSDLAPGFDYAVEHQLECSPFHKEEVFLTFPGQFSIESKFDEVMQKQITDWPDARAVIDLLPVHGGDSSANENLLSMATILPGAASANSASGQVPRLRDLGFFVYELLGGTPHSGGQRYVPIARVSAAGNDLLKSILTGPEDDLTAAQFAEQLAATAGFEAVFKPAKAEPGPATTRARAAAPTTVRPQPVAPARVLAKTPVVVEDDLLTRDRVDEAVAPSTKNKLRTYLIPAAAALILVIGLLWFLLARRPGQSAAKVTSENKPPLTASASPASPSPSLPPLTGNLLSTQYSPKRDIRVEQRSGGMIYLISQADEAKRYPLQKSSEDTADVLFSPDENWLVLNQRAHLNDSSGQLFSRAHPGEVEYSEVAHVKAADQSLTESAWRFYLKEVALPEGTLRDQVRLSAVDWKPDSSAVKLRFDSFGPDGQKLVPRPYVCAYRVSDKRFSSESDVVAIRAIVNASVAASNSPNAPAKTPPASPPPQGRLSQQEAFAFAQSNVSAMSAGDVNSLASQYGTQVDYLDKGLVSNDAVRNEFQQYFARWPQTNWRVAGPVTLQSLEPFKYQLTFPASFEVSNPATDKHSTGTARETMVLAPDSTGAWKIVFQRETVTSNKRSVDTDRNRRNEKLYKGKPVDERRPNIPFQIPSNIPWPPKIPHP